MGRILGSNVRNIFSVLDPVSGKEIELYYRMPTAQERVAYESAKFSIDSKGKVASHAIEARMEFGLTILEGFKKGAFQASVDGETKDIASDRADPDYDPDWKNKIKEYAGDLIEVLGHRIFDGPIVLVNQEERGKNL